MLGRLTHDHGLLENNLRIIFDCSKNVIGFLIKTIGEQEKTGDYSITLRIADVTTTSCRAAELRAKP
jgi:hypothetical protein